MRSVSITTAVLALIAAAALAAGASATETAWTNPGGGAFDDPANWDAGVPGPGDVAVFAIDGNYAVAPFAGTENERAIIGTGSVTFDLDPGAVYALTGPSPVYPSLVIGAVLSDNAFLSVLGGALEATYANIGEDSGAAGSLLLDGGASCTITDRLHIGFAGAGLVSVSGGATLVTQRTNLGQSSTGDGRLSVTGAGSSWTATETVSVGTRGIGDLFIGGGANAVTASAIIGQNSESLGTATVTGPGTTWTIDGTLDVGMVGVGTLTIEDGARVEVDHFAVMGTFGGGGFGEPGGDGELVVTGTGSSMYVGAAGFLSGNLLLGLFAEGRLVIADGASVSVANDLDTGSDSNDEIRIRVGSAGDWREQPALVIGRQYQLLNARMSLEIDSNVGLAAGMRFRLATARGGLSTATVVVPELDGDLVLAPTSDGRRLDVVVAPATCETMDPVLDCNGNGLDDACDIEFDASPDCNDNGTPDECDIADGTSPDCNGNGVPDRCDIDFAGVLDCDGDGVPDECDPPVVTITAEDDGLDPGDFGDALAADAGTAAVGAPGTPGGGAVHVYARRANGWTYVETLFPPDPGPNADFGTSVDLDGDVLVVGASGVTEDGHESAGAVYVYRRTAGVFVLEETLRPEDPAIADRFGETVAVDGDDILVGARPLEPDYRVLGYFFRRAGNTWSQVRRTVAFTSGIMPVAPPVALDAGRAAIGVRWRVHTFRRMGGPWLDGPALVPPLGAAFGTNLGTAVSIAGDMLVVAGADDLGDPAVYVYRDDAGEWREDTLLAVGLDLHDVVTDGAIIVARSSSSTEVYAGAWSRVAVLATGSFSMFGVQATALDGTDVLAGSGVDENVVTLDLALLAECPCPADVDGNGEVELADLLAVLAAWGPCPTCAEDIDANGEVDFQDLLEVLYRWGPCR